MFNKILVVCGECLPFPDGGTFAKALSSSLTVASAGLGALVGKGADPAAASVASAHDLSLENHCARQISARLCREYDLILTMEKRHIAALCDIAPEMRGKVMLFGHWDSEREIPDPYRKSRDAFEAVHITGKVCPPVGAGTECRAGKP